MHHLLLHLTAISNPISNFLSPLIDLLQGLLRWLESWIGNWGLAIIMLTIIVRIVIFPLTWKQIRSQLAMQSLQPKIKELQRKFKGDKKKVQQETMRLYQEYRINPLASCLPLLLQLPIFIGLYYAIRNTPELQTAHFLWFTLGVPDPYYILLIFYVASQLFSTELMLTPETASQQKWLMRAMPFLFIIMLRSFPAGLFVYWITTNLWTIGQQLVIRYINKHRPVKLEPVDPSKRKQSRFMAAMSQAQDQRETQKGGRPVKGGKPVPGQKRPAGKPASGGQQRSAGKPGAKPGAKPGGQRPAGKPAGQSGGKPGGGGQGQGDARAPKKGGQPPAGRRPSSGKRPAKPTFKGPMLGDGI